MFESTYTFSGGPSACRFLVAGFFYAIILVTISGSALPRRDLMVRLPGNECKSVGQADRCFVSANFFADSISVMTYTDPKRHSQEPGSADAKSVDELNRDYQLHRLTEAIDNFFNGNSLADTIETINVMAYHIMPPLPGEEDAPPFTDLFVREVLFTSNEVNYFIAKIFEIRYKGRLKQM